MGPGLLFDGDGKDCVGSFTKKQGFHFFSDLFDCSDPPDPLKGKRGYFIMNEERQGGCS